MMKRFHMRTVMWLFSLIAAGILGTGIGAANASQPGVFGQGNFNPITTSNTFAQEITDTQGDIFNAIFEAVSPSVVAISVETPQGAGAGSGFVIDTAGHIVTNDHVVAGATEIEVGFFDGTLARAEVVGLDPDSDLAVIRVDLPATALQPVVFTDSASLEIGQTVLAIGSPFGQRWTLTSGIISALGRVIQGQTQYSVGGAIQTDAAINPGNSGGPLLDLAGRVIGVNSQILSQSRSSAGVGFAIPSALVQRVARELIQTGRVNYSYIGITGGELTLDLMESLGVPNNTRGVLVANVAEGSPAAQSGLRGATDFTQVGDIELPQSADIIIAIDDQPVSSMADLLSYLATETTPGQIVDVTVLRNGSEQVTLPVILSARSR